MRHGTTLALLGIALLTFALSLCTVAMTPQRLPQSPTTFYAAGAELNLEIQQRRIAEAQEKVDALTQPATTEAEPVAEEDLPTASPYGVPIAHAMPWKGMPAELIGSTYLGEADEVGEVIDGGLLDGGTPYYWRSRNDRHDRVFEAVVRDGEVIYVSRWNTGRNYWPRETSLRASALPILDASGEQNSSDSGAPSLPDPNDYDDEDEYEADAEDYFAWLGCDDPAQAACLYWESIAG